MSVLADDDVIMHRISQGIEVLMIICVKSIPAREGVGSPAGWVCSTFSHSQARACRASHLGYGTFRLGRQASNKPPR